MAPLKKPGLYAEQGSAACPGAPALRALRSSSGHISFPPQRYGCQASGEHGDALQEILLSGRGTLRALATVHMAPGARPPAPFTVVEVALDDGPLVRGLLAADQPLPIAHGTVMVTCLEEVEDEHGAPVRDLRFRAAAPEGR